MTCRPPRPACSDEPVPPLPTSQVVRAVTEAFRHAPPNKAISPRTPYSAIYSESWHLQLMASLEDQRELRLRKARTAVRARSDCNRPRWPTPSPAARDGRGASTARRSAAAEVVALHFVAVVPAEEPSCSRVSTPSATVPPQAVSHRDDGFGQRGIVGVTRRFE